MNWFRPAKKHIKSISAHTETFILEPLITPSGLVDSPDQALDPALLQIRSLPIEQTTLPDATLAYLANVTPISTVADPPTIAEISGQLELRSLEPSEIVVELGAIEPLTPTPTFNSGTFTVGASGEVGIDFLLDGGRYQGEIAIFNLEGMERYDLTSDKGIQQFIQTAAQRAASGSNLGHIVILDATEGARFNANMGEVNQNAGEYQGVRTFEMQAGSKFAVMLVPNGTVQDVLNGSTDAAHRPLFSLATSNPNDAFHLGQVADVTGEGNTFVFEDLRVDEQTDKDYNDVVFQIRGATGEAQHLDEAIDPAKDWRTTDMGKALIAYTKPYVASTELLNSIPQVPLPQSPLEHQPLVGIIDTGFNAHNPHLDYSRITVGYDYVQDDNDSLLEPGQDGEHGTHILGIIGATQGDDIETDGINDQAPIWVSRAVGSGEWAESLVEFVDAAKASAQPQAVVNLSFDLTQINPDGSVTTRYELTPTEWSALEYARQNHVLIVAAAGNDGSVMSALGQASQVFDNIITTGSAHTTHTGSSIGQDFDRTNYSSYGYGLDLVAEGGTAEQPILSTVGEGFGTMAGTSVAAAQVTGAVSQVWAANPELSYRQVIEILKNTATDLKLPDWDLETGSGLLNIAAAVHLAKATQPENYETLPLDLPTSWSGEGLVTPLERSAASATDYRRSLDFVLRSEGGFVNHPNDPGGATNQGITQGTYNDYRRDKGLSTQSVQFISRAEVEDIYLTRYWRASGSNQLSAKLALVNFDTAVNMGVGRASQFLSQARQSAGNDEAVLVRRYLDIREAYYRAIVSSNPSQGVFLQGWLNRLADLRREVNAIGSDPVQPTPSGRRAYVVKAGDTLSGIAFRQLGSANRWREISKDAAGQQFFTEAEARLLQLGRTVYLPVNQSVGSGTSIATPITPAPNPTPDWQRAIDQAYANSPVNLGLPIGGYMDASRSPQGTTGKFRNYQNGTIHWTQKYGAIPIWFDLQREYNDYSRPDGSRGWLGFPTRREYDWNGGRRTDFEGGYIYWNGQWAKAYRPGEMPPTTQPSLTGQVSSRVGSIPLNFRSSAAVASNNKIGDLAIGTSFKILERVNGGSYSTTVGNRTDWLKIELNSGRQGYVAGYYVDIDSNNGGGGNNGGSGNTGGAMTREGFVNWATGQVGIRRLDGYENLRGQCVTLIARYVQEVYLSGSERTRNRAFGDGKDTARTVAGMLLNSFEPYTKNGLPRRGAVISFPGPNTLYGHTAIVMESRTFNGQRQVRIMDSNGDNRGVNSTVREYYSTWINIDSSSNGYGGTNGWTNPR
jgi:hypothetical protein